MIICELLLGVFITVFVFLLSVLYASLILYPQYLQMKWPLLDVPGSAGLKDSRSPTPGHLVSTNYRLNTLIMT